MSRNIVRAAPPDELQAQLQDLEDRISELRRLIQSSQFYLGELVLARNDLRRGMLAAPARVGSQPPEQQLALLESAA